jgi:hypothetical protein
MAERMGCSPAGRKAGGHSSVAAKKRTSYWAIAQRTDWRHSEDQMKME